MSLPAAYPRAEQILRGDAPGRWAHNGPYKIVWHTTETLGLPSYDNDDDELDAELAPHLTYDPKTRRWWQDYPLTRPSESLRVHDDDMAIQVEIICYSDKRIVDRYGGGRLWVGHLPDTAYRDLAEFSLWVASHVELPAVWPSSTRRMTSAAFHAYNGHCGHVHVPDNTHWDPGVFDYKKLFSYIEKETENMITTWLDENGFRRLFQLGVVQGGSEDAVVQYWVTERAERTLAEHVEASSNILVDLAELSTSGAGVDTSQLVTKALLQQHEANPDAHHE